MWHGMPVPLLPCLRRGFSHGAWGTACTMPCMMPVSHMQCSATRRRVSFRPVRGQALRCAGTLKRQAGLSEEQDGMTCMLHGLLLLTEGLSRMNDVACAVFQ